MEKFTEKILKRYVIADLSSDTNYLVANGFKTYSFINNISVCTKFVEYNIAELICNECSAKYNLDLVVVPIEITYNIIQE